MRNALTFLVLAAGLVVLAVLYPGVRWGLLWAGGNFVVVAAAYARQKPQVFGKRADGTMAWGPRLLLLPYLWLTWLVWYGQTRFSREAVWDEVAPGLWLGRRASAAELPPGISLVVDLTSEFAEPSALRTGRVYLYLPSLDNAVPDRKEFEKAVQTIAAWEGGVYIHCALGHGRSALVMAAVLAARGLAGSPEEAWARVKQARPGVKLDRVQQAFLMSRQ